MTCAGHTGSERRGRCPRPSMGNTATTSRWQNPGRVTGAEGPEPAAPRAKQPSRDHRSQCPEGLRASPTHQAQVTRPVGTASPSLGGSEAVNYCHIQVRGLSTCTGDTGSRDRAETGEPDLSPDCSGRGGLRGTILPRPSSSLSRRACPVRLAACRAHVPQTPPHSPRAPSHLQGDADHTASTTPKLKKASPRDRAWSTRAWSPSRRPTQRPAHSLPSYKRGPGHQEAGTRKGHHARLDAHDADWCGGAGHGKLLSNSQPEPHQFQRETRVGVGVDGVGSAATARGPGRKRRNGKPEAMVPVICALEMPWSDIYPAALSRPRLLSGLARVIATRTRPIK